MKKLLHKIFGCRFTKPIASQYTSFNGRNIIFECKCGKRKMVKWYDYFGIGFPIETSILITDKEMERILNSHPIS